MSPVSKTNMISMVAEPQRADDKSAESAQTGEAYGESSEDKLAKITDASTISKVMQSRTESMQDVLEEIQEEIDTEIGSKSKDTTSLDPPGSEDVQIRKVCSASSTAIFSSVVIPTASSNATIPMFTITGSGVTMPATSIAMVPTGSSIGKAEIPPSDSLIGRPAVVSKLKLQQKAEQTEMQQHPNEKGTDQVVESSESSPTPVLETSFERIFTEKQVESSNMESSVSDSSTPQKSDSSHLGKDIKEDGATSKDGTKNDDKIEILKNGAKAAEASNQDNPEAAPTSKNEGGQKIDKNAGDLNRNEERDTNEEEVLSPRHLPEDYDSDRGRVSMSEISAISSEMSAIEEESLKEETPPPKKRRRRFSIDSLGATIPSECKRDNNHVDYRNELNVEDFICGSFDSNKENKDGFKGLNQLPRSNGRLSVPSIGRSDGANDPKRLHSGAQSYRAGKKSNLDERLESAQASNLNSARGEGDLRQKESGFDPKESYLPADFFGSPDLQKQSPKNIVSEKDPTVGNPPSSNSVFNERILSECGQGIADIPPLAIADINSATFSDINPTVYDPSSSASKPLALMDVNQKVDCNFRDPSASVPSASFHTPSANLMFQQLVQVNAMKGSPDNAAHPSLPSPGFNAVARQRNLSRSSENSLESFKLHTNTEIGFSLTKSPPPSPWSGIGNDGQIGVKGGFTKSNSVFHLGRDGLFYDDDGIVKGKDTSIMSKNSMTKGKHAFVKGKDAYFIAQNHGKDFRSSPYDIQEIENENISSNAKVPRSVPILQHAKMLQVTDKQWTVAELIEEAKVDPRIVVGRHRLEYDGQYQDFLDDLWHVASNIWKDEEPTNMAEDRIRNATHEADQNTAESAKSQYPIAGVYYPCCKKKVKMCEKTGKQEIQNEAEDTLEEDLELLSDVLKGRPIKKRSPKLKLEEQEMLDALLAPLQGKTNRGCHPPASAEDPMSRSPYNADVLSKACISKACSPSGPSTGEPFGASRGEFNSANDNAMEYADTPGLQSAAPAIDVLFGGSNEPLNDTLAAFFGMNPAPNPGINPAPIPMVNSVNPGLNPSLMTNPNPGFNTNAGPNPGFNAGFEVNANMVSNPNAGFNSNPNAPFDMNSNPIPPSNMNPIPTSKPFDWKADFDTALANFDLNAIIDAAKGSTQAAGVNRSGSSISENSWIFSSPPGREKAEEPLANPKGFIIPPKGANSKGAPGDKEKGPMGNMMSSMNMDSSSTDNVGKDSVSIKGFRAKGSRTKGDNNKEAMRGSGLKGGDEYTSIESTNKRKSVVSNNGDNEKWWYRKTEHVKQHGWTTDDWKHDDSTKRKDWRKNYDKNSKSKESKKNDSKDDDWKSSNDWKSDKRENKRDDSYLSTGDNKWNTDWRTNDPWRKNDDWKDRDWHSKQEGQSTSDESKNDWHTKNDWSYKNDWHTKNDRSNKNDGCGKDEWNKEEATKNEWSNKNDESNRSDWESDENQWKMKDWQKDVSSKRLSTGIVNPLKACMESLKDLNVAKENSRRSTSSSTKKNSKSSTSSSTKKDIASKPTSPSSSSPSTDKRLSIRIVNPLTGKSSAAAVDQLTGKITEPVNPLSNVNPLFAKLVSPFLPKELQNALDSIASRLKSRRSSNKEDTINDTPKEASDRDLKSSKRLSTRKSTQNGNKKTAAGTKQKGPKPTARKKYQEDKRQGKYPGRKQVQKQNKKTEIKKFQKKDNKTEIKKLEKQDKKKQNPKGKTSKDTTSKDTSRNAQKPNQKPKSSTAPSSKGRAASTSSKKPNSANSSSSTSV